MGSDWPRASQAWGVRTQIANYSLIAPPLPTPATTRTEVAVAEVVPESEPIAEVVPDTTDIAAEGGLSLLGWWSDGGCA